MISTAFLLFALVFPYLSAGRPIHDANTLAIQILDRYIIANNDGSDSALELFIHENYNPVLVKKIKIEAHVNFYRQIAGEFGPLHKTVYETVESTPDKLIVHLIKEVDSPLRRDSRLYIGASLRPGVPSPTLPLRSKGGAPSNPTARLFEFEADK